MTFPPAPLDPIATAGLETREVQTGERDGVTTKIAIARRTYGTDQADLWNALTDPERLPRWFLPIEVEGGGPVGVGARYRFVGNAGGVVQACESPRRVEITWEMQDRVSWVEVTLEPEGDRTTLQLRHEAPYDEGFWTQFGPGAVGVGWDTALMGLGMHLDGGGAALDPAQVEAWSVSPDGIAFTRASADGWADAAIADGDDAAAAREASERTVAFYTTVPDGAQG